MGHLYGGLSAANGRLPGWSLHLGTPIRCVWGCSPEHTSPDGIRECALPQTHTPDSIRATTNPVVISHTGEEPKILPP